MMLNQYQGSLQQADSIELQIKKYPLPCLVSQSACLLFVASLLSSAYGNERMMHYPEFSNLTDTVDYSVGSTMLGTAYIAPMILIPPVMLCIRQERLYGVTAARQAGLALGIILALIISGFLEGLLGAASLGLRKPEQLQFAMRSAAIGNFNAYPFLIGSASIGILANVVMKACFSPNARLAESEEINHSAVVPQRPSLSL